MNALITAIVNRRSIREFQGRCPDDTQLQQLIQAGQAAPSAMNSQPWHFTVVRSQSILGQIAAMSRECLLKLEGSPLQKRAQDPEFHNFYHAPAVIFISAKKDSPTGPMGCGMAAQNIALAAASLNLGTCIVASFLYGMDENQKDAIGRMLQLPEGVEPCLGVAVGYVGREPNVPERRNDNVNFID